MNNNVDKKYWPHISYCAIITFINITVFVILNTKLNFSLYAATVIFPIFFWPALKYILDKTNHGKKIKKLWFSFPKLVHKGIALFCLIWSGYFIFKIIIPVLKENYAKNK